MTRKEIMSMIKRYFMAILIAIPILFVVDMLIFKFVSNVWLIVIDCFIILLVYVLWLLITQKYRNHITKKRTEFLHKKEQERKMEEQKKLEEKKQQNSESPEKGAPTKIIQKQKRNYQNKPSKKHKKRK